MIYARPLLLITFVAVSLLAGCSAAPSPAADTPPLREGADIARQVGEQTRQARAKEPELVKYASSISSQSDAPQATSPGVSPEASPEPAAPAPATPHAAPSAPSQTTPLAPSQTTPLATPPSR